eukprot:gb/GEZJ01006384.1/.p2 GENE.gb/GEZJ01006384.1/~~gb/GEZJ01006384.1/.p2  ORF type:complete len:161 (-),score=13.18 gb/GEZJ01006384.1/:638-1120(-)
MSDGPTHFKNETIRLVSTGLMVPHHFTVPYSSWSNRAVERLGKELLRVLRATFSEFQMRPEEWPDLLPVVQSVLNKCPSPQRGNVSPLKAFTVQTPTPPVSTFIRSSISSPVTLSEPQKERCLNISRLQSTVVDLHPLVQAAVKSGRERSGESISRGTLP